MLRSALSPLQNWVSPFLATRRGLSSVQWGSLSLPSHSPILWHGGALRHTIPSWLKSLCTTRVSEALSWETSAPAVPHPTGCGRYCRHSMLRVEAFDSNPGPWADTAGPLCSQPSSPVLNDSLRISLCAVVWQKFKLRWDAITEDKYLVCTSSWNRTTS